MAATRRPPRLPAGLLAVITVAVLIRIPVAYFAGGAFQPRVWEYEEVALNVLSGRGFGMQYCQYGFYWAPVEPLFPYLCAAVYAVFGTSHAAVLAIQFALAGALAATIYLVADQIFENRRTALMAGLFTALHPGLLIYSTAYLHSLNLYVPLFFLTVLLLGYCYQRGGRRRFLMMGAVAGIATLSRATALPAFVAGILFIVLFGGAESFRRRALNGAAALIVIAAVSLTWTVRNFAVIDGFAFSTTTAWEAFWVGNNPNATGGRLDERGGRVEGAMAEPMAAELAAVAGLELRVAEVFRDRALDYARSDPAAFLAGIAGKAYFFWWFAPQTGVTYPRTYFLAYAVYYSAVLLLAAGGLIVCVARKLWTPLMAFPVMLVVCLNVVHALTFVEMRHRWTVEPVLLILAAVAINWGWDRLPPRSRPA